MEWAVAGFNNKFRVAGGAFMRSMKMNIDAVVKRLHQPAKVLPLTQLSVGAVVLTDQQWSGIASSSGLPDEAREAIGRAIASYQTMAQACRSTTAETRKALQALVKHAGALALEVGELTSNPRAIVALTSALVAPSEFVCAMEQRQAQARIEEFAGTLAQQSSWMADGAKKLHKSRPGAREKAFLLRVLVCALDQVLLEHRDHGIERSRKRGVLGGNDWVEAICRVADSKVGRSAIDEAMKDVISARHKSAAAE